MGTSAIAAVKRSMNSSARDATTMNRFEAMHDCPLFCTRAVTASGTVRARSALARDDERVRAAELEHRLLQVLARLGRDGPPRALRAGERHRGDPIVGDHAGPRPRRTRRGW